MGTRIVIFAKAPVPGHVKTRLIPVLGAEGAARLAHRMLLDTCDRAASVAGAGTELCTTPASNASEWDSLLPPGVWRSSSQGEGNLGARLARAAQRVIAEGDRVVLIGTDCPELDARRLESACRALERSDAVIHPAFDGGYALLGLSRFDPSIFSGIAWSTATVAADTTARIEALGWSLVRCETLRDVDEPEDLAEAGW